MKLLTIPLALTAFAAATLTGGSAWGQAATDLVCVECVGATDLAPNAVNNSKIGNGAVNAAKLATNAVTVAKIANNSITTPKLTTASVTRPKIAPNAINANKIANAAVTAAKIAPDAVNQTKIADGAVGAAQLGIQNTTYIEDSGDAVANCTELMSVLGSATAPDVVVLGPGTFDCGVSGSSEILDVPAGVSLIGSGRYATTLTADVFREFVNVGAGSVLKSLTVVNTGATQAEPRAVRLGGAGSLIDDVRAEALAGTDSLGDGMILSGGGLVTNSEAIGPDAGVIQSVQANEIRNSTISGGVRAVQWLFNPITIVASSLSGPTIITNTSDSHCVASYDADARQLLEPDCSEMP